MQLSEDKAKEVLDFLVHKIDSKSRWFIEEWIECFILKIETPCINGGTVVSYARENTILCCCMTRSCRDMLGILVDRARKNDIVYRILHDKNSKYVLIPYMTTLEQILIDMDLSSSI